MKRIWPAFAVMALLTALLAQSIHGQTYTIQQYLNIRSATAPDFSPNGLQIAYLTNVSGTSQVWIVDAAGGKPRQLTNYDDNVSFVRWAGDGLVFGKAKGGDENTQFYWMKPDGSDIKALTIDATVRHNFGDVSWDGKTIYYASNKRHREFFDVYSMDLAAGSERLIYQQDGNNSFVAVSDSGSRIIVSRNDTDLSLDNNLYLVDTATKAEMLLTPHKGASQYSSARFVADGIVLAHNEGREFVSLAEIRKKNAATGDWSAKNREAVILDDTSWDAGGIEMSTYGNTIAYTLNRDGFSELLLRKYETGGKPLITVFEKTSEQVKLPGRGLVGRMSLTARPRNRRPHVIHPRSDQTGVRLQLGPSQFGHLDLRPQVKGAQANNIERPCGHPGRIVHRASACALQNVRRPRHLGVVL
jgi:dipeptidyl aminopeptidase/acylaminoacyl peptidase